MGMNTICYLCLDCENTMGLLPNGDPNPDHCDCDTDVRHWQSMNNRDLYWNHNTDGFDCDCDDCYKFRNDKSNWDENGNWKEESE